MTPILQLLAPELLLAAVACVLILMGAIKAPAARRLAPIIAILALAGAIDVTVCNASAATAFDAHNTVRVFDFANYIRVIVAGVGIPLMLLCWPSDADAMGGPSVQYGRDGCEFFGLMLLAITGVMMVAVANDIILLFLGLELASIPGYILVSMSRPQAVAQESAVKYFFLGALSAALMLFGFSYLYGATGSTQLIGTVDVPGLIQKLAAPGHLLGVWEMLGIVMVLLGLCFKIAAVPLHFYVADVYQGAATPIAAFLAFVPKTAGMVAILKLLFIAGGPLWAVPSTLAKLLWIIAVLTMTAGNVLALMQQNVKRVLAWSSVAHSGYMLVGVAALLMNERGLLASNLVSVTADSPAVREPLQGILFYLPAYGLMTLGAFAVLMLVPGRSSRAAMTAETYDEITGAGRRHVGLGLAMAVCCFSLTGMPLTAGFLGKFYLIRPVLWQADQTSQYHTALIWLVVIMVVNAAISAGYYLRIVATMFLRNDAAGRNTSGATAVRVPGRAVRIALITAVAGTLILGTTMPLIEQLMSQQIRSAATIEPTPRPTSPIAGEAPVR